MSQQVTHTCPLCQGQGIFFQFHGQRIFYVCETCSGVFLDSNDYLDPEAEKKRYMEHNNDVEDIRYQRFVSPVVQAVLRRFTPEDKGLDYGAGTGPVITKVLTDRNYDIVPYDPFFCNQKSLLNQQYNYIVCCEVIEHFHRPGVEFSKMRSMLSNNGCLYCMTDMLKDQVDLSSWYYVNDPTHVFLYKEETFLWIKEHLGYSHVDFDERLIIMYN